MKWTVHIKNSARKGIDKLPEKVRRSLALLLVEIETAGPVRGNWPKDGVQLVEVTYAGTHERAPY